MGLPSTFHTSPAQEIEAKCEAVMPRDTCRVTCASGYFEEELLGEKLVAGETWDFFGEPLRNI